MRAPLLARSRTVSFPIPSVPPVMTTVFPSSRSLPSYLVPLQYSLVWVFHLYLIISFGEKIWEFFQWIYLIRMLPAPIVPITLATK